MLGRQAKGIIETEALQLEGAGLREKQKEARLGQGAGCVGGAASGEEASGQSLQGSCVHRGAEGPCPLRVSS